jgi:PAS domain S-box-containing protein
MSSIGGSPSNVSLSAASCQAILECLSEALIFADNAGLIQLWNPGAEFLFGYTRAESIGQSLDLIIPEHLRKAHWDGFHRAVSAGATVHARRSIITRALHKSGQPLYVDMSFALVKNQAGETIGSTAVARDATQRHFDEKNLRRQLAELTARQSK